MNTSTAIAKVGEMLIMLLQNNFDSSLIPSTIRFTLLSPDEINHADEKGINLFLYQVEEAPFLKNREWIETNDNQLLPPPLSLNLFYLMTPYGKSNMTPTSIKGQFEVHTILGEAMRIFSDNPIVPQEYWFKVGGLSDLQEPLKINQSQVELEELARVWSTFSNIPFRLSVPYEISVVQIDSKQPERSPAKRVKKVGVYPRPVVPQK